MKTIYLDNNATTAVAPEVREAILPYLGDLYFNPSSMYQQAVQVAGALNQAQEDIAEFLGGVFPDEILFTSGATESNNTALYGSVRANPARRHIVTSAVEHPAILEVVKDLERTGCEVSVVPVDENGNLDMREFVGALRPDTLLVSIMHANNESGVIFPINELARIVKETSPEILFHSDATQSVGKVPINLRSEYADVDLLSFSGHKLHAPKGIGALYVKRGTALRPYLVGGHQQQGRRAGTENAAFIVGLAKACKLAAQCHAQEEPRITAMRDKLERELTTRIPFVHVSGKGAPRLGNTLNISFHYIEGEGILYQLNEHGICASSGSACTSGSLDPSHVLKAMGVPFTALHGSVRFSLSRYTSEDEIDEIIKVLPEIVQKLRRLSPYWDQAKQQPRPGAPRGEVFDDRAKHPV